MDDRYKKIESSTRVGTDVPLPTNWVVEDVEIWLSAHAMAANSGKTVDLEMDLFAQGFDR